MKTEAQLVDRISQILEDTGNAIFADATQIQPQLQDSLKELSYYDPWIVRVIKMAENSAKLGTKLTGHLGREIDLSDIDYIYIDKVEYPVGNFPPTYKNFQEYNKMLFLEIDPRPSSTEQENTSGTAQKLTGTVTFTSGSPSITGSGTSFTKELEVGYYISKSGSSNWYRVASITSDTALTLSINVASADTGADTSGATRYWYQYVYIFCAKNHYVEATQTDFTGAIDAGAATGYADDTWQINVDALGTGVMPKDMLFTIAGTEGIYRITEEATITTNNATLKISPRLKGRATEDAVVTFFPSSLTPQLEDKLCDLTAAKIAQNWVGTARTALNNAVTAYGLANTQVDLMTARIAQAVTDLGTARTAASADFSAATTSIGKAITSLQTDAEAALDAADLYIGDYTTAANQALAAIDLANSQIDLADTATDAASTDLTDNHTVLNTAIASITTELAQAITDLDSARAYINTVPAGNNPETAYATMASQQLNIVSGKMKEIQANIEEAQSNNVVISGALQSAREFLREASSRMSLEAQLTNEDFASARERVRLAYGSLAAARGYVDADRYKVNSLADVISGELRSAQLYTNQAGGYFSESAMSLRTSQAIHQANNWAINKYNQIIAELRRMSKPRQKIYSYPY